MKKRNATLSALFTSVMCLLLCISMLVGTTFAWFTDSVASGVNHINAGNLDVELYYGKTAAELNEKKSVKDQTNLFTDPTGKPINLWEPGVVAYTNLQVVNKGNLALKYNLSVNFSNETVVNGHGLSEALKVAVVEGGFYGNRVDAQKLAEEGKMQDLKSFVLREEKLETNEMSKIFGLVIYWQPTDEDNLFNMNNENQGKVLSIDLGINLFATQVEYADAEYDSFGPDYDADSWNVVYDEAGLRGAVAEGLTTIKLGADITLTGGPLVIPAPAATTFALRMTSGVTLNLGGFTLTGDLVNEGGLILQDGTVEGDVDLTANTSFAMNSNTTVGDIILSDKEDAADATANIEAGATFENIVAPDENGENQALTPEEIAGDGKVVVKDQDGNTTIMDGAAEDGMEYVAEGLYKDANDNYYILNVKGMYSFAAAVNGGNAFKGKTVCLSNDVDLNNQEWTPIGNSTNKFQGTFDGNDKTISNLKVNMPGESNVGLFGYTTDGEIKNLTVENATVTGRLNVGVIAGTPYTTKYTSISVIGHVEVNGMSYVGGVGGKNAYANWDKITVDVDSTSYVKANSIENGTAYRTYVGGVVGFNGEGGHTFSNITSNINVIGSTCDVGGAFGIAHYGNNFENVTVTGNVTIDNAAEAADAEEMGGIAGVWNNGGADVIFTNCSFTGNLSANITDGVDLTDNTITGAAYSADGTGKLIVDGKTTSVVAAADMKNAVTNAKNGDTIYAGSGNVTLSTMAGKEGLTIIGAADGSTVVGGENATNGFGGNFGKDTTIKNLTFNGTSNGVRYSYAQGGTSTFDNCTFAGDSVYGFHIDESKGATFIFNNCTFSGFNAFAGDLAKVTFNNCTFLNNGNYGHTNIWSIGEFNNCTWGDKTSVSTRGSGKLYFDGVEESYHHEYIGSAESLFAFASTVNVDKDNWKDQKVLLVADIDLNNAAWTPIGQTGATEFKGIFDGQGYTISNLNVDSSAQTGEHYSSGLFGWAESNVTIRNVNIDGATVVGNHNVAALVGYTYSAKITNCHVTNAAIACHHANDDACGDKCGLIVGYAADEARITGCSATDSTVEAGRDAGQLVGCGYNVSMSECSATNVTVTANGECTGKNINEALIGRVMG